MPVPGANIRHAIRAARPLEAALLTELALRSKGYWGYDAEFLAACRAELTLAPSEVAAHPFFVIETEEGVAGFYSLREIAAADEFAVAAENSPEVELNHLYVEPSAMGRGCGARLWKHAVETARRLGYSRMSIPADPFAEPFYLKMGAVRAGEIPSGSIAGRVLPLLHFALPPPASDA